MSDAFEGRRRGARRGRVLRVVVPVALVVLVGLVVWAVAFSSLLAVRTVRVSGLRTLTAAQVQRVADVPQDRPLVRLDTVAIESRVAKIARVRSVRVHRSWPHTVRIEVVERVPVAWTRTGAQVRAIDADGVDYRGLAKVPKGLPQIEVTAVDARRRQQALQAAAGVVADLRRQAPDVLRALRGVEATTKDSVLLRLTRGRQVMWGSEAQATEKTRVLRALLKIRATRYDVSAPEQPTTRK